MAQNIETQRIINRLERLFVDFENIIQTRLSQTEDVKDVRDKWFGKGIEEERELSKFNLERITYRVVIFDILPFYSFENPRFFNRRIEQFGYFKNDYKRKPFLLFRSVIIRDHFSNVLNGIDHLIHGRYSERKKMFSIESLKSLSLESANENSLGRMSFYPNLQSLRIKSPLDFLHSQKKMNLPKYIRKLDISLKIDLFILYEFLKPQLEFPADLERLTLRLKTSNTFNEYLRGSTAILQCVLNNKMFTEMKCFRTLKSLEIKFNRVGRFGYEEIELRPCYNRSFFVLKSFINLKNLKISAKDSSFLNKFIVISSEDLSDLYDLKSLKKVSFINISMDNSQFLVPHHITERSDLDLHFENFSTTIESEGKIKYLSELLFLPKRLRKLAFSYCQSSYPPWLLDKTPQYTLLFRSFPKVESLKLSRMNINVKVFQYLPKCVKYLYLENVELINDSSSEFHSEIVRKDPKNRSVLWEYEHIVFNRVKIHLDVWKMYFKDRVVVQNMKCKHNRKFTRYFERRNVKLKHDPEGKKTNKRRVQKTLYFRHVMIYREELRGEIIPSQEFHMMNREKSSKDKNNIVKNQKFSKKMKFGRKPKKSKKKYYKHFCRRY